MERRRKWDRKEKEPQRDRLGMNCETDKRKGRKESKEAKLSDKI